MQSFFKQTTLVNTRRIQIDKVQRISVSYIAESITLHIVEGDTLVLEEYLSTENPKAFAVVTTDSDGITIRHGERENLLTLARGAIVLYLPRSYFGVLNLKTISGRIQCADRLSLSELAVSSTSGRISLGIVTAGTAVLSSVSGSIGVEELKALSTLHSTSGSLRILRAGGAGEFSTVSGSIEVPYHTVTGDISASSTSGRIRLQVPAALPFSFSAQNVTGNISVLFEGAFSGGARTLVGTVGERPRVRISLRSVSGRLELLPLGC